MNSLLTQIGKAGANLERIARKVMREPALVPEAVDGLRADDARVKYGCAKVLRNVAQCRPELLYPYFDSFMRLLDSENKILQWEAAFLLSHLAGVDALGKFDAIFGKYFAPVAGPVMITAANVMAGGARVALARPEWADRIASEVLKVGCARYQTAECRNVAIGHAIKALSAFFGAIRHRRPVVAFVRRQLRNSRPATRKKAQEFLRRWKETLETEKDP